MNELPGTRLSCHAGGDDEARSREAPLRCGVLLSTDDL